uniref:Uncharacterized protein n=1 Tax=Arundo donax TaxID=35708 RepID=A0A0A9BW79_ARUDO
MMPITCSSDIIIFSMHDPISLGGEELPGDQQDQPTLRQLGFESLRRRPR